MQTSTRHGHAAGAVGFRVRTGYATAVLLAGPAASPTVLARRTVDLCDMKDPDARQPFHVVTEQDERRGMELVRRTTEMARVQARRTTRELIELASDRGCPVRSAGLVVGSDVDPAKLGHPHIRAHAMEGRLYREAVESGASSSGLPCTVLVEREAYAKAAPALGRRPAALRAATLALGRVVGRPWGAQEKMAALAAWVALTDVRARTLRPRPLKRHRHS